MAIISGWLGLTQQQFDILTIVYDLKLNKVPIKAGNILSEYKNRFGKDLQRQNFFSQLKPLLNLGILEKRERAAYEINKDRIKSILDGRKRELEKESGELNQFSDDIDLKFKEIITEPSKPIVTYLTPDLYIETIASLLNKAKIYYADSPFPNISYTEKMFKGIGREKFVLNQRINCFDNKKLNILYLTNLCIDLTFRRALKVFNNNRKLAYLECKKIIENLKKQVKEPNLDMRYLEILPGPHMYIFEYEQPRDLILSLRGSNVPKGFKLISSSREPYGGVHIISTEIATQVKNVYMSTFQQAIKLNSSEGKEIIENVENNLEELYKQYKKKTRIR